MGAKLSFAGGGVCGTSRPRRALLRFLVRIRRQREVFLANRDRRTGLGHLEFCRPEDGIDDQPPERFSAPDFVKVAECCAKTAAAIRALEFRSLLEA